MTLREAAAKGVERVRLAHWANPSDYVKIDIIDGLAGPWAHLYSPVQDLPGYERPQNFPSFLDANADYEPYDGPLLEPAERRE
jgi:hypothetical protein